MGLNWKAGIAGAAGELQRIGQEQAREQTMMRWADYQDRLSARREERLAELRSQYARADREHADELQKRDRRAIGAAMTTAGQPVTETLASEEGDSVTTRQPGRAEVLAAGEAEALRQGDIGTANTLRTMGAPKHTKVGQDETIVNERGEVVFANTAGADRRKSEADYKHGLDMKKQEREYELRGKLERFKASHGTDKSTAMIKDIEFLVANGVATDHTDAFNRLRTRMNLSDEDAIRAWTNTLMKSPSYRGRDGAQRAARDARGIVDSLGDDSPTRSRSPGQGQYQSAEDIRSAFKAGRIERDAAIRELKRFGYTD